MPWLGRGYFNSLHFCLFVVSEHHYFSRKQTLLYPSLLKHSCSHPPHARAHTHRRTRTHTRTHIHMHARTHARTHACTYTRSREGYASFKQVEPWPWHGEVIPGVGVVALVTNEELLSRTLCVNTPLLEVSCCSRFKISSALILCSVEKEGSGRMNLPALRCREFNCFKSTSPQYTYTYTERERETDRQTDRQAGRQAETETDRQTDGDRDRDTQRDRDTDRQADRHRERQRQRAHNNNNKNSCKDEVTQIPLVNLHCWRRKHNNL